MVEVKGKLRAAGPLMPDRPNNCYLVLLIEGVPLINEEETPVLLLGVLDVRIYCTLIIDIMELTQAKYYFPAKCRTGIQNQT